MHYTRFILALVVTCVTVADAVAGDPDQVKHRSLRTDVLYLSDANPDGILFGEDLQMGSKRSVPKAFAMSALVPGLGQVYNKSWWKAGLAVAAEAALVTAFVVWRNQGNDGVDEYEAYARGNWSPIKYAQWLNDFKGYSGPDIAETTLNDEDFLDPGSWTQEQSLEVERLFNDIRAAERRSTYLRTGAGFSHVLPYFGEQQYYELIGKYFQFAPGWADYSFAADAYAEDVMPADAQFYYYAGIHADANDLLRRSSWIGALIFINHFASGIQAAVSAKLYNMSLQPSAQMKLGPNGDPMASAGLVLGF